MRRHFIFEGDTTAVGGIVSEGHPGHVFEGRHASFEGARIECPACRSTGAIRCVGPMRPYTLPNGRQVALEGDLCLCKCAMPPRLVASQMLAGMAFDASEMRRAGLEGAHHGEGDQ